MAYQFRKVSTLRDRRSSLSFFLPFRRIVTPYQVSQNPIDKAKKRQSSATSIRIKLMSGPVPDIAWRIFFTVL